MHWRGRKREKIDHSEWVSVCQSDLGGALWGKIWWVAFYGSIWGALWMPLKVHLKEVHFDEMHSAIRYTIS